MPLIGQLALALALRVTVCSIGVDGIFVAGSSVVPTTGHANPTLMIVAEGDDITLWEEEIDAFNRIPAAKKRLFVVDHTTHMVLYSNRSQLEIAADQGGWVQPEAGQHFAAINAVGGLW